MTIDRLSRRRLALALRRYVAGRISNDAFEDVDVDLHDPAIGAVQGAAWVLYSDMEEHYARGTFAVRGEYRRRVARWVLFLRSGREYLWPEYDFYQTEWPRWMEYFSFGSLQRERERREHLLREFSAAGDIGCWPFISRADFEAENARQGYLRGESV
jgi:hypothetical protein